MMTTMLRKEIIKVSRRRGGALPVSVKKDTMSPMFRSAKKASTAELLFADFRPAHIPTAKMRM